MNEEEEGEEEVKGKVPGIGHSMDQARGAFYSFKFLC